VFTDGGPLIYSALVIAKEDRSMRSQEEKCIAIEHLHSGKEVFIIPNPWDTGSARVLQGLGFKALATTSSGLAYTLGRLDGEVTLEEKLAHCTLLSSATEVPVSADFENAFADDPEGVAKNLKRLVETGVAGCSVEDFSRDSRKLYEFNHAVERVQAAVEAVTGFEMPFQLTARAENLIRGVDNLEDTINRLKAFEAVGAHVLYPPGLKSVEQVRQVVTELVAPVNVLVSGMPGVTVDELGGAGARRISIGGALCWAAVSPIIDGGREMLEQGTFNWLGNITYRP
jgi:2-methylisocitrate lyase-like PEP mutase family enzyme